MSATRHSIFCALVVLALPLSACAPFPAPTPEPSTPTPPASVPATADDPECESPAFVECEDQVVRVRIPLVGTNLALAYASDRVPGWKGSRGWDARELGLGGWALSVQQAYDPARRLLFAAGEPPRTVEALRPRRGPAADTLLVASQDGLLVHLFSAAGRHLRTLDALTGTVLYEFLYDNVGRLQSVRDRDGNETRIERRADGTPVALVGPFEQRTLLEVDPSGFLARVVVQGGAAYAATSTEAGLLKIRTDPFGNRYEYGFDGDGRLVRVTDPATSVWTLSSENRPHGHRVTRRSPLGLVTTFEVERLADGSVRRSMTGPGGDHVETVVAADGSQELRLADGTILSMRLGPDPRFGMQSPVLVSRRLSTPAGTSVELVGARTASLTDPQDPLSLDELVGRLTINDRTWTRMYEARTRTITTRSPAGRDHLVTLDVVGRIASRTEPGLPSTRYVYEQRGRVTRIVVGEPPDERTIGVRYLDAEGLLELTDPLGHVQRIQYDRAGWPIWQTLPDGSLVIARHDPVGNLVKVVPASRPAHFVGYGPLGRRVSEQSPGTGEPRSVRVYDADGRLWRIDYADRVSVELGYDDGGRLTEVAQPEAELRAEYDGTSGYLAGLAGPGNVRVTYARDGPWLLSETWTGPIEGGVVRAYDAALRIARDEAAGSAVVYAYDADDQPIRAGQLELTRDQEAGRIAETRLGSLVTRWHYDSFGDPVEIATSRAGRDIYSLRLTRDGLGRIVVRDETIEGQTTRASYTYDANGRLVEGTFDGQRIRYEYDLNGNRTAVDIAGARGIAAFDEQDRVLTEGDRRFTYAADGSLETATQGSATTRFGYDRVGNLRRVELPDGRRIEYLVDARGRRVGKHVDGSLVQGFLYADDLRPIAELDESGRPVGRFVYLGASTVPEYVVRGGSAYRILTDPVGSPRLVVDATSGRIVERIDYDPFGRIIADTNPGFQPFGFAGGLADRDTGLVRFGVRDYDPASGRWTAPDPVGFAGGDANLYRYAGGDPVNRTDPAGLWDPPWPDTFGFSVGGSFIFGGGGAGGVNAQYFPGEGWKIYGYTPTKNTAGFSIGFGVSANAAWKTGEPDPLESPSAFRGDPWEGIFQTAGGSYGPVSYEAFRSNPPLYKGADVGVGLGAPAGAFYHETEYTCIVGCGSSHGEPHVFTPDRLHYEFQMAGEFVAVASTTDDFMVQVRQEPYPGSKRVTLNTAVAMNVAGDRVAVYLRKGAVLKVDGQEAEPGEAFLRLPHGGRIDAIPSGYRVTWPDGSRVNVYVYHAGYLDLVVDLVAARRGKVAGLFGNFNEDPSDDIVTRGGERLVLPLSTDPSYRDVTYARFGESWRIRQHESLFDYERGASTNTYTLRDFPDAIAGLDQLAPETRSAAEATCRAAGVSDEPFVSDCILDVGLTGDPGFATGAARSQGETVPPRPTQTFAVAVGAAVGRDQPAPGAGRIDQPRAVDEFTFQSEAGQLVYLEGVEPCADTRIHWTVTDPAGEPVRDAHGAIDLPVCFDFGRLRLALAGTYTITVAGLEDQTGDYAFKVRSIRPDDAFTIAIGDVVAKGRPGLGAGEIEEFGAIDRYTFTARPGTVVYLDSQEPCAPLGAVWSVVDRVEKVVENLRHISRESVCSDLGTLLLADGGGYTIIVTGGGGQTATGAYRFQLWRVPAEQRFDISIGDRVAQNLPLAGAGSIESPGAIDRYAFKASAGKRLFVDVLSAPELCSLRFSLLGPDGTLLLEREPLCNGLEPKPILLRTTGSYFLIVHGDKSATGTYSLRIEYR